MEERKVPPTQRGNIDGITPRKPAVASQTVESPQVPSEQNISNQNPASAQQTVKTTVGKKPKKSKNLLVIILAAIVLIGLSTFAVYTELSGKSADQAAKEANSGRDNATGNNELIDQTINEIDQLNDQSDESGTGLSDEQLGL